jgi:Lon-like ATP-dependent protease
VDEGIEILTGVPAGERGPDGTYPPDSVNGKVDRRLHALAEEPKKENKEKKEAAAEKPEGEPEPAPAPPREPELPGDRPEPAGE